jgi:hypothetical protein
VVDRSLEQQLRLRLRRHAVEELDFMLGQDVSRRRSRRILERD